jgi:hypothetical protein
MVTVKFSSIYSFDGKLAISKSLKCKREKKPCKDITLPIM